MASGYLVRPEFVSLRLGKATISKLRDLALKESMKKSKPVTVADIVKDALKLLHPDLFSDD